MRTEISQAKKENQFYLNSVERSKALKRIEDRKRKRGEEMDFSGIKRMYRQRRTIPDGDDAGPSLRLPDELLLKVSCLLLSLGHNYLCSHVSSHLVTPWPGFPDKKCRRQLCCKHQATLS